MKSNNKYGFLDCVKTMPPLYHSLPNEQFSLQKSEVVAWLIKQPEIQQATMPRR